MATPPDSQGTANPAGWILLVDDELAIREMLTGFLADSGIDVVATAEATAALAALDARGTEPLLALVDVLMPGMDGLTLARKLRARFKRGRIIIMSGHLTDASWWPEDLRDVEFLPKPFRRDAVLERVEAARRLQ